MRLGAWLRCCELPSSRLPPFCSLTVDAIPLFFPSCTSCNAATQREQVLGPRLLGESVTRSEFGGGLVIVCGVVLTTAFGPKAESELPLSLLLELWARPAWITTVVVVALGIGWALGVVHDAWKLPPWCCGSMRATARRAVAAAALSAAVVGQSMAGSAAHAQPGRAEVCTLGAPEEAEDVQKREKREKVEQQRYDDGNNNPVAASNVISPRQPFLTPRRLTVAEVGDGGGNSSNSCQGTAAPDKRLALIYAFLAGALGGQQNVVFKGVGEMVSNGGSAFSTPGAWIFVGLTAVLAVGQISYINQGLAHFDGVLFLPLYSAMLILLGTSASRCCSMACCCLS